jgi:hypothetical protein
MNKKQEMERFIFERFATVSELDLDLLSIQQPSPPQPEILCTDKHGQTYAFELVLVTNEDMMESISTDSVLIEELQSVLKALTPPYNNSVLGLTFARALSVKQRKILLNRLLAELTKVEVGFSGNISLPEDLKDDLHFLYIAVHPDLTAPLIWVDGPFGSIGHPPIHRELRTKLIQKAYESMADSLELLAYYNGFPAFFEFAGLANQMHDFVSSLLQHSKFKRVWIFDASNERIIIKVP